MRKSNAILFIGLFAVGCQPAEEPSTQAAMGVVISPEEAVAQVRQVFQQYETDWNATDLDGVLNVLAENVIQMAPNDVFVGRDTLAADWTDFMTEYDDTWEPVIDDIRAAGDLVFVVGHFTETRTPRAGGETTTDAGEGVWIFKQHAGGNWKLVLEQWFARDAEM